MADISKLVRSPVSGGLLVHRPARFGGGNRPIPAHETLPPGPSTCDRVPYIRHSSNAQRPIRFHRFSDPSRRTLASASHLTPNPGANPIPRSTVPAVEGHRRLPPRKALDSATLCVTT